MGVSNTAMDGMLDAVFISLGVIVSLDDQEWRSEAVSSDECIRSQVCVCVCVC